MKIFSFVLVCALLTGYARGADDGNAGKTPPKAASTEKQVVGKIVKLAEVKDDIVANVVMRNAAYKLKATGDLATKITAANGKSMTVKGTLDGEVLTVTSISDPPAPKKAAAK